MRVVQPPDDMNHWYWHIGLTIVLLLSALWNWMKHGRSEKKLEHIDRIYRRLDTLNAQHSDLNATLKSVNSGVNMLLQHQIDKEKVMMELKLKMEKGKNK